MGRGLLRSGLAVTLEKVECLGVSFHGRAVSEPDSLLFGSQYVSLGVAYGRVIVALGGHLGDAYGLLVVLLAFEAFFMDDI